MNDNTIDNVHKYKKKPIIIQAIQVKYEHKDNIIKFIQNCKYDFENDKYPLIINLVTLEGKVQAKENDYIIKGVAGECYPIRQDIFLKTYDKVKLKGGE